MSELEGYKELSAKLARLGKTVGSKTLRSAASKAVTPVMRKMRAAAPVGSRAHRTYKGRLVAPGFLKRSLRRSTRIDRRKGSVSVRVGVRREAYYGVLFYDEGQQISSRRVRKAGSGRSVKRSIKPYTLKAHRWFKSKFISSKTEMERDMKTQLKTAIEKVARRG